MDHGIDNKLKKTLQEYKELFTLYDEAPVPSASDILLNIFNLSGEDILKNKQYWHRHLGACWEKLVKSVFSSRADYQHAVRIHKKSPCDFAFSDKAIDTKYRLGSGDSGTLEKLAKNAAWLKALGYFPVMLILRSDNLPNALSRMSSAGWQVLTGDDCFEFIRCHGGLDLKKYMLSLTAFHLASPEEKPPNHFEGL